MLLWENTVSSSQGCCKTVYLFLSILTLFIYVSIGQNFAVFRAGLSTIVSLMHILMFGIRMHIRMQAFNFQCIRIRMQFLNIHIQMRTIKFTFRCGTFASPNVSSYAYQMLADCKDILYQSTHCLDKAFSVGCNHETF